MARYVGIGLWLLPFVGFLGIAGCADSTVSIPVQAETPEKAPEKTATPKTLAEQALSLWQRDIDQYRQYTRDPQSVRPKAEEFMRAVQQNMLPRRRGPRLETTAEMGKKLFEQGARTSS